MFLNCVDFSIEIYMEICEKLKPTPNKPFYLFNLRDLSRVIQGIQLVPTLEIDSKLIMRLCLHENFRVFSDRLSSKSDVDWFAKLIASNTRLIFKEEIKNIMKPIVKNFSEENYFQNLKLLLNNKKNKNKFIIFFIKDLVIFLQVNF